MESGKKTGTRKANSMPSSVTYNVPNTKQTTGVSSVPTTQQTTGVSSVPETKQTTVVSSVPKTKQTTVVSSVPKTQQTTVVSKVPNTHQSVQASDVSTSPVASTNVTAEPKSNLDTIMEKAVELATESDGMEKDLTDLLSEISKIESEIKIVDDNEKSSTNIMIQMQAQYDMKKNLEEHSMKVLDHLRRRQARQQIISLKSIHVAKQILTCITQAEEFANGCETWLVHVEDAKNKRTECNVGPLDFFDQVKTCTEVMKKHFETHKDSLIVK